MTMPADGSVIADLATLKLYVGARSSQDDQILQERLDVARGWVYVRCYEDQWLKPDVQEAILLMASRLYKRRQSPEGQAGWGGELTWLRMTLVDPDVETLIEPYRDWSKMAIG